MQYNFFALTDINSQVIKREIMIWKINIIILYCTKQSLKIKAYLRFSVTVREITFIASISGVLYHKSEQKYIL